MCAEMKEITEAVIFKTKATLTVYGFRDSLWMRSYICEFQSHHITCKFVDSDLEESVY